MNPIDWLASLSQPWPTVIAGLLWAFGLWCAYQLLPEDRPRKRLTLDEWLDAEERKLDREAWEQDQWTEAEREARRRRLHLSTDAREHYERHADGQGLM